MIAEAGEPVVQWLSELAAEAEWTPNARKVLVMCAGWEAAKEAAGLCS